MMIEPLSSASPEIPTDQPPRPGWLELILYILFGFGSFLLVSLFVVLVAGNQSTLLLTVLAILANFVCLGGSALLIGRLRKQFTLNDIGFYPVRWRWSWLFIASGIAVSLLPIRLIIGLLVQLLFEGGLESLEARSQLIMPEGNIMLNFIVTLIGVGLLAPISEELFFRGAIYTWFRKHFPTEMFLSSGAGQLADRQSWLRRYASIIIAVSGSSFLFSLAHFDSIGVVASSFLLAIILAIIFEYTRSIWATIAIHAINNSLAVILTYGSMILLKIMQGN